MLENENMNEAETPQLNIGAVSCCYNCGSKAIEFNNSLHCYDIKYECGARIIGVIGKDTYSLDIHCPNSN
jgi:hypothetical protein